MSTRKISYYRIHTKFDITPTRATAWLSCMSAAMDEIGLQGHPRQLLLQLLTNAEHRFVNSTESLTKEQPTSAAEA